MEGYLIYTGTASTLYCRRAKINIIRIDIQYTNLWTDQQAYSIRGRQLCRDSYLLLIAIDIDRPFHKPIITVIGIDRQCDITIVRTIAYCADLSEPIDRGNRYR